MSGIQHNIPKLYLLYAFQSMSFGISVIVPFTAANGISLEQFFLLQAAFSLAMFFLEVPSGYASDTWGRKPTLVVAAIAGLAGSLSYAFGTNVWHFLVAELFLAVLFSFQSGTIDAITYETYLELGDEPRYKIVASRQQFINFMGQALASVIGGMVAYFFGMRAAMLCTFVSYSLTVPLVLTLAEPSRHRVAEKQHVKALWKICYQVFRFNIPLRSLIVLFSTLGTMTLGLVWLTQVFQEAVHLPLFMYGPSNAVMMAAAALVSSCIPYLRRKLDDRHLLIGIASVILLSYFAIGQTLSVYGLLFFLSGRAMWGAIRPLMLTMVQQMTPSHTRATILSLNEFVGRLIFVVAAPGLGFLVQYGGPNQAATIVTLVGAIIVFSAFLVMRPVWRQLPA